VEQLEDRLLLSHSAFHPPEFVVNAAALPSAPGDVAIAADNAGDFVVAWTERLEPGDFRYNVFARRFNPDGVAQGGDILVTPEPVELPFIAGQFNSTEVVDVAMTPAGDFAIAYHIGRPESDEARVVVRYYDARGADLGEVTLSPDVESTRTLSPALARDALGHTFVAFLAQEVSDGPQLVEVQVLDAAGHPLGPVHEVSTAATFAGTAPSIASDGAGNFVVAWNASTESGSAIFARRFTFDASLGARSLDEGPVQINGGTPVGFSSTASVGRAGDTGGYVIAWDNAEFGNANIFARRFDAAGNGGPVFTVNESPLNSVVNPNVSASRDGEFVVSWSSGQASTIFARPFNADGTPENATYEVNLATTDFGINDVASDGSGNFIVAWPGFPRGAVQSYPSGLASDTLSLASYYTEKTSFFFKEGPGTGLATAEVLAQIFRRSKVPSIPPPVIPPPVLFDDSATLIALANASRQAPTADPFVLLTFENRPAAVMVPVPRSPERPPTPLPPVFAQREPERPQEMGEISGQVFLDLNGNGEQDEGEPGLAGQLVFLDMNGNGIPDPDEPQMLTDRKGRYLFSGLPLTRYRVRQDLRRPRVVQTTPERNTYHVVELSPENYSVSERNFGAKVLRPAGTSSPASSEESQEDRSPKDDKPHP
jgi:hypothetical protein